MKHARCFGLASLLAAFLVLVSATPVHAEGTIYFGGYGFDHPWCGGPAFPCGSYNHARQLACNSSENTQDTFHVSHVIRGYQSSCDMAGGSGREPRILGRYDWTAIAISLLAPTAFIFIVSLGVFSWYSRRAMATGNLAPS